MQSAKQKVKTIFVLDPVYAELESDIFAAKVVEVFTDRFLLMYLKECKIISV